MDHARRAGHRPGRSTADVGADTASTVELSRHGQEIEERLTSRTAYETLHDGVAACHEVSDLLVAVRESVAARAAEGDREFLLKAIGHGFAQIDAAMSHGFEVYGQELDPIKYHLRVAVAIARYAAEQLR